MASLKQIEKDHSLVCSLNKLEIEKILSKNKGKHFPVVRKLLKERLKEIKNNTKVDSLILNIEAIYQRVFNIYEQPATHSIKHARAIANDIHDLPFIFSGKESTKSLKTRKEDSLYAPCKDHFYPRLWAGLQIVNQIYSRKQKFLKSHLAKMLYEYCHVNYVTEDENNFLRQFQTIEKFVSPEKAYKEANINLKLIQPYTGHKVFELAIKKLQQNEKKYK